MTHAVAGHHLGWKFDTHVIFDMDSHARAWEPGGSLWVLVPTLQRGNAYRLCSAFQPIFRLMAHASHWLAPHRMKIKGSSPWPSPLRMIFIHTWHRGYHVWAKCWWTGFLFTNPKSQAPNPKQIQNSNDLMFQITTCPRPPVLNFEFGILILFRVWCFGFVISNLTI